MESHENRSHLAVNPWPMGDRDGTPKKSRRSWFTGSPQKAPPLARDDNEEDLPVLKLTHFTKKVMVCFDTIRTGTSRTKELLVENPCDFPQELCVEKFPFDKGFSVSATCWELDGCELMRLPIAWTPKEEGNAREMVTFKCEGAFRLQVILLGTAEDPPKKRGPARRSTFAVHRKVPLKATQPQAVLKPSRPTMILKAKGPQRPQAPGKQPRPPTAGKTSRANQENRVPPRNANARKSVVRPMVPAEVESDREQHVLPSTPSPRRSVCDRGTLDEFAALDSSLAEIYGDGMPVTGEDLLLENLKRQTLSVCSGMSPLVQTAQPFMFHDPAQPNTLITRNEDLNIDDCGEERPTVITAEEASSEEASSEVPEYLSMETKSTVTKNKAPAEEQASKPAAVRKNLFVSDTLGGNISCEQIGSRPHEFEDSLNEPGIPHVPNDIKNGDKSISNNVIIEKSAEVPEDIIPVANHAEQSLEFDTCQSNHVSIPPVDAPYALPVVCEPSLDSGSSLPLLRHNSARHLEADDFKVHTSIVTSNLIRRKRVSDPKEKMESPPKKPKTKDVKSQGARKQPPPPRDRTMNRTLALRKAAAAEKCGNKTAKAKPLGKPAGQYKAKAPMKGLPMAKLTLLKPNSTAIARHPMPFAAKNMFYDERWMEKQERGFTRWLNHVLTPEDCPVHPSCKATKIDAGTLCVEPAGHSTVPPAPSKEDLSLRAYTAKRKLNRLRRGACMLFQSEPIVRVLQKLEAEIEKRRIVVRQDRKLHADYGIKQKLLELFLSYNPLWLRIGLETTYGEILPIQSNTDVIGLSRFVITRLLGNPDIASQFAHPTVPHLYGSGYEETLSQFTLKKFLILVFFLDRAKLTRLIDHDPCLFCKDSEFKSSRDILLHFSREYLRGEGDLTKHLSFMGYSVTHRQTALDEFDFSVTKLATDLRCGVRLARVVELLLQDWSLSSQLRVPAISRLQKIHNVEITLKAVKLDGGGVDARAIVDGHREKTLELLWRIIFQFQIGVLLNEQQIKEEIAFLRRNLHLQKHLDAFSTLSLTDTLREGVGDGRRDSNEPNVYFKSGRLSLLLKWCQVVCSFYGLKVENFTVAFSDGRALCYLVHHYHPTLLPLALINQDTTQTQYQRQGTTPDRADNDDSFDGTWSNVYSPSTGKPGECDGLLAHERENFKVLYDKVSELGGVPGVVKSAEMSNTIPDEKVVITYVSYLCARLLDLRLETRAARTIQTVWKAHRLRRLCRRRQAQDTAARTLQDAVRSFLTRRRHQRLLGSVIALQATRRRVIACRQVQALRQARMQQHRDRAATSLQAYVRGFLARRHYQKTLKAVIIQSALRGCITRRRYLQTRRAIITVQAAIRCCQERRRFNQKRQAAVVLQQQFRARHLASMQRALYRLQRSACVRLQAAFRGYACRQMYRKKRLAVTAIQAHIRGHLQRMRYLKMKVAVLMIQRYWQSARYSKSVREEYLNLRRAAIIVQSFYRGMIVRRHAGYMRRVVKSQAVVRCFLQRRRFSNQRRACVVIQKTVRGYTERSRYTALRAAALVSQQHFRAKQMGQLQLIEYNITREAVITLQAWVRGGLARRWLAALDRAAVRIQSVWKMHKARNNLLAVKTSTRCLQTHVRAYLTGKATRGHYLKMKASAVLIQSQYRSIVAQRKFDHQKACCINVQSYIRMYIARKRYREVVRAVLAVQRRFRAKLNRDRQVEVYHLQRRATITLQAWFRGILARQQIAAQHKAAVKIQSSYEAYRQRRSFKMLCTATVCLQRHIRAHLIGRQMRIKYLKLKTAAVLVQSSHRGLLARRNFNAQKQAAVKIQSVVRMHQAHSYYLGFRRAVMIVQTRYRAQKLAQATFIKYQIMRGACITLQAWFRRLLVRREMLKLHTAAVVIQKCFRSFAASSKYQRLRAATVVLQRHWRATKLSRKVVEDFGSLKKAAVVLQSAYRGKIGRHIATEHRSARLIQSYFRMHLLQQRYQRQKCAAVKIQASIRMQQAHNRYILLRRAALTVQTRYRAKKTGEAVCCQYQTIRRACITLQAATRGALVRLQMQKLHMAATQIQKSFRSYSSQARYQKLRGTVVVLQTHWRATSMSRQVQADFGVLKKAAVVLQSAYRGKIGRHIATEHRSARLIQSYFRMHLLQQRYQRQKCAAVKIQASIRMQQAHSRYILLRQAALTVQTRYRAKKTGQAVCCQYQTIRRACITLQAATRGYLVRREMQKLHIAATRIQTSFRSYLAQARYQKLRGAVVVLQTHWRATRMSRQIQRDFGALKKAAVVLQSAYRGRLGRSIALRHSSARLVQSYFRMYRNHKQYQSQKHASIKIQSAFRKHQAHMKYAELKRAAIVIQRKYKATKLAEMACLQYHIHRGACITLQAYVRGFLVRQHIRRLHSAAAVIQKNYVAYKTRTGYKKIRDAAAVLQTYWRATRVAREQRLMFVLLKKAAVILQSAYRGRIGRKIVKEHRAARLIQSEYRMHVAVREYTKLRTAAVTLQAAYRMHRARQHYRKCVAATQTIQQFFRGYLITRAMRSNFLQARSGAVKIQAAYRGFVQRRSYIVLKQAATRTQALYRGKRQSQAYQALRRASVVLQAKYRAHVLRTKAFRAYNIQRGAAITIQATYKAHTTRHRYVQMKWAATAIQSSYRGHRQRTDFLLMKKAAASLQTRYRARLLMREAVQHYQAKRQAAIAIQSLFRAHAARCRFVTVKSAAIAVQSFLRGNRQRLAYQQARRAAVVLQTRYRAHRLQREATVSYHIQRGAAITIQAYQRGRLARQSVQHLRAAITIQTHHRMRTQRRRYLALRRAANRIGASFRAHVARRNFLCLRLAALTIQTRYRALTTARLQRGEYRLIRDAVITIQSFARGRRARKLAASVRAAVKIQSAYRGHVQHGRYRAVRQTTVFLQALTRGTMARQQFAVMKRKWRAAVCIQRHLRGSVARKALEAQRRARLAQLERFSSVAGIHLSAIRIQRCYRLYKMRQAAKAKMHSIVIIQQWMRASLQRLHFVKLRRGMVALQRRVRRHRAVRGQAAVRIQTQARLWLARRYIKKMNAAALTMQAVWRGLRVRRSCKSKKIAGARARCIEANKAATEERKLCNLTTSALDYLLRYRQMSGLLEALISLDVVSRLSAACCERLVEGQVVPVIFTLIKSCNRSLPCMEVIKYSVNILLNLTKYPPTASAVFDEPDSISTILDLIQMYREKGAQIFSKVCTLMGILSQDPRRAQTILSARKNKERLLAINRLTERKYSLAAQRAQTKARGLNASALSNSSLLNCSGVFNSSCLNASRAMHAATPSRGRRHRQVQPEWVLGRGKMREIADPLEACHFVMETLHLK